MESEPLTTMLQCTCNRAALLAALPRIDSPAVRQPWVHLAAAGGTVRVLTHDNLIRVAVEVEATVTTPGTVLLQELDAQEEEVAA